MILHVPDDDVLAVAMTTQTATARSDELATIRVGWSFAALVLDDTTLDDVDALVDLLDVDRGHGDDLWPMLSIAMFVIRGVGDAGHDVADALAIGRAVVLRVQRMALDEVPVAPWFDTDGDEWDDGPPMVDDEPGEVALAG